MEWSVGTVFVIPQSRLSTILKSSTICESSFSLPSLLSSSTASPPSTEEIFLNYLLPCTNTGFLSLFLIELGCSYLNSSSDSSIRFLMNCTWNGNIPALPTAPATSGTHLLEDAIPTVPLGKGSTLCFVLSNIKLWAGDTEIGHYNREI